MKLLFDLKATQSAILGPGGGGEYARAVFRHLVERDGQRRLACFFDPAYPLDAEVEALVGQFGLETVPVRNLAELQTLLASGRFSSFMSGMPYAYYGVDFGEMEVFLAVHGLRPLEQAMTSEGRYYAHSLPAKLKWLAKYGLERLRPDWRRGQFQRLVDTPCRRLHLLVPSWHTRYSMVEKLNLPPAALVHSFYCPETEVGRISNPDLSVLDRLGLLRGRYLLMVSGGRWIKNSWRALKAAVEVMDKLPDARRLPIVITGGIPGGLPRGHRSCVVSAGNLAVNELAALYAGARAFVYPTLNEGFGYPPLEAMAQGTPVICSAVSAVTEILGDAALYFCPTSLDEIKIRLRMAVEDDALLAEYQGRGRQRLAIVRQRQDDDLEELCQLLLASVVSS